VIKNSFAPYLLANSNAESAALKEGDEPSTATRILEIDFFIFPSTIEIN
jgi:hypothetical protein